MMVPISLLPHFVRKSAGFSLRGFFLKRRLASIDRDTHGNMVFATNLKVGN